MFHAPVEGNTLMDIWTVPARFEVGIKNIHIGWVGKWAQSVKNLGRMKMI